MPESLYDDNSAAEPEPIMDEKEGGEEGGGQPQLVNMELCPDCEVGDVLKVKVVRKLDKEIEIAFMGKDEGMDDEPHESEPSMATESDGESLMD